MSASAPATRPETQAALAAVDTALGLIAARAGSERVSNKGARDIVTATDVAVEDAIRAELSGRFPAYTIVGEERGGEADIGDRPYWLVDPICGTRNFASNIPLYCANIALVENGLVTVAVAGDGASGQRYLAERGNGAWLLTAQGRHPIRVGDSTRTLSMSEGASVGFQRALAAAFARIAILSNRWWVRMLGSTVVLPHLAAGRLSAHLQLATGSPVHTAAGVLLATEAGALITDLEGSTWSLQSLYFLASASPAIQDDLLEMLAAAREQAARDSSEQ